MSSSNNNNNNSSTMMNLDVGHFFTIDSYVRYSKIFPDRKSSLASLYAGKWGFNEEPTDFSALSNNNNNNQNNSTEAPVVSRQQQQQQSSSSQQQNQPAAAAPPQINQDAAVQPPPAVNNKEEKETKKQQQHQEQSIANKVQMTASKPKKKVTIVLTEEEERRVNESMNKLLIKSASSSHNQENNNDGQQNWPMINVEESEKTLKSQAGKPLQECFSTIPAHLHEAFSPVYQIYLRAPHYFDSDFDAKPQHRQAFDTLLLVLSKEQSAYQNRVADLVIRSSNSSENSDIDRSQNFIATKARELYDDNNNISAKKFKVSGIIQQVLSFVASAAANNNNKKKNKSNNDHNSQITVTTSLGSAPCRIPHVIEKAKIPSDSIIVSTTSAKQLSKNSFKTKYSTSKIFSPPLQLLTTTTEHSPKIKFPPTATALSEEELSRLHSASDSSSPVICFSLSALESLGATCIMSIATPQGCISGDIIISDDNNNNKNNNPIIFFDTAADSDSIPRREVMRKYYSSLLLQEEKNRNLLFLDGSTPAVGNENVLVKVNLVDAVHELEMELKLKSGVMQHQQNKKRGKNNNNSIANILAQQQLANTSKFTSFYLQVPIVATKQEDGSPVILLVKPEYSSSTGDDEYRLERFSDSEILFMFLCLRCVPRSSILVVRVVVAPSSSSSSSDVAGNILATEMINIQQFNLILQQSNKSREIDRVFCLISGIVSKLKTLNVNNNNNKNSEDASKEEDVSQSPSMMLSLVRQVDSSEFLFIRHPSLVVDETTAFQKISDKLSTQGLRKAILPVDSWNIRSNQLMLSFPPTTPSSSPSQMMKEETQNRNHYGGEHFSEKDVQEFTPEEVFRCIHSTIQVDWSEVSTDDKQTDDGGTEDEKLQEDAAAGTAQKPQPKKKPKRLGTGSKTKGLHF